MEPELEAPAAAAASAGPEQPAPGAGASGPQALIPYGQMVATCRALFDQLAQDEALEPHDFQRVMAEMGYAVTAGEIHDFVLLHSAGDAGSEEQEALTFEVPSHCASRGRAAVPRAGGQLMHPLWRRCCSNS